jgi:hypothetical protein
MTATGGFVTVRAVRGIRDSGGSLVCELSDGYHVVIPTTAIGTESQVKRARDFGTLVVQQAVAIRLRLGPT